MSSQKAIGGRGQLEAIGAQVDITNLKECLKSCYKNSVYFKELKSHSLPLSVIMILMFTVVINNSITLSSNAFYGFSTYPEQTLCYAPEPQYDDTANKVLLYITVLVYLISTVVMAYLGDAVIGHYNAVKVCLWVSWLGTLLQVVSYCIQYGTCGLSVNIAKYGISGVASILINGATGGFYANMLSCGIDQLPSASSTQIRAFVHWLIWAFFLGLISDYLMVNSSTIYDLSLVLYTSVAGFCLSSLVIALSCLFNHRFECVKPPKRNPYRVVYEVMRYAWRHKAAANRSAFTYWEGRTPSRIDLAKERYGGPFVDQEPEDVKTFWYILAVILSFSGFFIPYSIFADIFDYLILYKGSSTSLNGYGTIFMWASLEHQVLYIIPLLELVILPLFPKLEYFFVSPMKGLFISYFMLILGLVSMAAIDVAGRLVTPYHIPCFLSVHMDEEVDLSVYYFIIPLFFFGLNHFFGVLFAYEFICSQAPSNLHGMLSGALWLSKVIFVTIGNLLISVLNIDGPGMLSCGFWILLLNLGISIAGLFVYMYTTKCYRRRQRDEGYHYREVIEDYFSRNMEKMW